MQHTPVGRFEWEKLILRVEIDNATKLIALAAATYGNPDGSRVGPSVPRLAAEFEWSERYISDQLSILRSHGLIEQTRASSRGNPTLYHLTVPAAGVSSLPMRTDVNGFPWIGPRMKKRGGRKKGLTGTGVQGNGDVDLNSSSGERPVETALEPVENPLTGTGVQVKTPVTESCPELEFHLTRTGVPSDLNSSSPDHIDQTKTTPMPGSYRTPTSEPGPDRTGEHQQDPPPAVGDLDYARASKILKALPGHERDYWLTAAREALTAERTTVNVRALTVRAAALIAIKDTA